MCWEGTSLRQLVQEELYVTVDQHCSLCRVHGDAEPQGCVLEETAVESRAGSSPSVPTAPGCAPRLPSPPRCSKPLLFFPEPGDGITCSLLWRRGEELDAHSFPCPPYQPCCTLLSERGCGWGQFGWKKEKKKVPHPNQSSSLIIFCLNKG